MSGPRWINLPKDKTHREWQDVRNVGATNPFPFKGAPLPKLTPVT